MAILADIIITLTFHGKVGDQPSDDGAGKTTEVELSGPVQTAPGVRKSKHLIVLP
jgi:hypothetical protein